MLGFEAGNHLLHFGTFKRQAARWDIEIAEKEKEDYDANQPVTLAPFSGVEGNQPTNSG